MIAEHNLPEPRQVVETSSFVTLRGLVMDSDRVTILSRHQILREEQAGMLAVADVQLPGTARAIGLTTRASGVLSPAARLVVDEVRKVIAAL